MFSVGKLQWHTQEFCLGGGSTNSVEHRGQRERGLGAVAPLSGVPFKMQMSETRIPVRLLWMYFPRNWEFGSALSKLQNFGGVWTPPPPLDTPLESLTVHIVCDTFLSEVLHNSTKINQVKQYFSVDLWLSLLSFITYWTVIMASLFKLLLC
jgi:hypothetical protein